MKIHTSEIEFLREEVKNCHKIIKELQKKREFVGLTDEEMAKTIGFTEFTAQSTKTSLIYVARAIEAKIKEKNS